MRWPLMWTSDCVRYAADRDLLIDLLKANSEVIQSQQDLIKRIEEENKALILQITSHKCNDYTQGDGKKAKTPEYPMTSRGGWRARSERHSESTIKPVGDSVAALENRVSKQGGIV